jgi:hypothetical protein
LVGSKLIKLYDALETEEFKSGELTPRIKTLFEKKEDLQQAKLEEGNITKQKSFLRSFINRIEVNEENAKIVYTLFPEDPPTEIVGVLPFVHDSPLFRFKFNQLYQ